MICRGSELDNLLLVLLLVLVAHQTKFQQICFNEVVFLVVGDTWTSRARQRSMKTVRHGKVLVQSNWLVFWSRQTRFSIKSAHGGSLRRARGPGGTFRSEAGTGSSATCRDGADRRDSSEGTRVSDGTRLRDCSNALHQRQNQRKRCVWGRAGLASYGYIFRLQHDRGGRQEA